jgi:hypothetical protein
MLQYLVIFGSVARLGGAWFYIRDTLKGKTKPNRVTWLLWSVPGLLASAVALSHGFHWSALPILSVTLAPLTILASSFFNRNAYWKLHALDYVCGLLGCFTLIFWILSGNPFVTLILAIAIDILAAIPTLIKSWNYPETETSLNYLLAIVNALTGFVAVQTWVFIEYGFITYMVCINALLLLAIYHKRLIKIFARV